MADYQSERKQVDEPGVVRKLIAEEETERLIEEGRVPDTLKELQCVLNYCEKITEWNPVQIEKGIQFLIKEIRRQLKHTPIIEGKLVWESTQSYELLQWMVVCYRVVQEEKLWSTRKEGATPTISG